jgi:hypothetical protein
VRRNRVKYRRRRLGALVVAAALAMGVYAGGVAGAEPQPVHYTVAPGDTLWGIAIERTAVWEDPRPKVEAIREANHLNSLPRLWYPPKATSELPGSRGESLEDRGEVCLAEEVERFRRLGLSDGEIASKLGVDASWVATVVSSGEEETALESAD